MCVLWIRIILRECCTLHWRETRAEMSVGAPDRFNRNHITPALSQLRSNPQLKTSGQFLMCDPNLECFSHHCFHSSKILIKLNQTISWRWFHLSFRAGTYNCLSLNYVCMMVIRELTGLYRISASIRWPPSALIISSHLQPETESFIGDMFLEVAGAWQTCKML